MPSSFTSQTIDFATVHPLSVGFAGALGFALYQYNNKPDLSHIPAVGATGLFSFYESYRDIRSAREVMEEGYLKYRGNAFRIPLPDKWQIIITSPELINELRLAKDTDLSFTKEVEQVIQTKYTMGEGATNNTYHIDVVRSPLTRNLVTKFHEIHDEIVQSFNELIPANDKEWMSISALTAIQQVVCRTSNRLFLGLPICREPEWIKLNIQYAIDAFGHAQTINAYPEWLHPVVGSYLSPISSALQLGRKFLGKEIAERLKMDDEFGREYDGRPNDLISWLLDFAEGEERNVDKIIARLLMVNIAAIHTSSSSFAQALYNLAAYPEYVAPLREEVMDLVERYGWTKTAMTKMRKIDSFLKETSRMEGLGAISMVRKVVNPAGFTFSNGLHLPYNSHVAASSFDIHHDTKYYRDPTVFDGFRFSKMRDDNGEGAKHQMVATSLDYLNFGHGKNACPGRFFAANELKIMLAHVVTTYDIAMEGDTKPQSFWFGLAMNPNPFSNVLFKRLRA